MSDQDLKKLYERVTTWQRRIFPNQTAASILKHMRKELAEVEAAPFDVEERADMAILAMGVFDRKELALHFRYGESFGAWGSCDTSAATLVLRAFIGEMERGGAKFIALRHILYSCTFGIPSLDSEEKFLSVIAAKMDKNEARRWPAPSEQVPGQPVEHLRDDDKEPRLSRAQSIAADMLRARISELTRGLAYAQSEVERHGQRAGQMALEIDVLKAERAEWRANNDRLRAERQRVREILGARPHEGVIEAARRVMVRPVGANPGAALAPGEEAPQ